MLIFQFQRLLVGIIVNARYQTDFCTQYQKVEMHNEYIAFDGVIRNDTLKATVNVPITITQVLH